jgi:hypothetical protein
VISRRTAGVRPGTSGRRTGLVAVVSTAALVAGACLPPGAPDPTGTAPVGNLEQVVGERGGLRVRGWVRDPDTSAPIPVSVSSNQRVIAALADLPRPDVTAAFPGAGPNHGFDVVYPLPPGRHQVCVWADNVGRGTQARALGCDEVEVLPAGLPRGNWESVTAPAPGTVRVAGWADDPDSSGPVEVLVQVGGRFASRERARLVRADVGAALGVGPARGFDWTYPVAPGNQQLCVRVINVGSGRDLDLGCRTVVVPAESLGRRPACRVTMLTPVAGGFTISGTATDPDGAVGLSATITVTGGPTLVAPVVGGAFNRTVTGLGPGSRQVCVTLVDVSGTAPPGAVTGDRPLPCGTLVLGARLSVAAAGAPTAVTAVGPAPTSPLARIDRDAGVSARLRDGSVLWFFADSTDTDDAGNLRYFVNNTAGWASAADPTLTRDAVTAGGAPVEFAAPTAEFPSCPSHRPRRAMWPMSAVVDPVTTPSGPRDRVQVFLGNVCLGPGFLDIEPRGVAVARVLVDPADPPVGRPIVGTVVAQRLFRPGEPSYGNSSVLRDGLVHAHQCTGPAEGGFPDAYGPCTVGRVPVDQVADRASWRWWDGTSWTTSMEAAAPMVLPDGPDGRSIPVAAATVSRDEVHGVYVLAYSSWPGFTDRVAVRVAEAPEGPWTAPVTVFLPGCDQRVAGSERYCYAATAQPALSAPGELGLGYYDQLVEVGPTRGQYRALRAPFSVLLAG